MDRMNRDKPDHWRVSFNEIDPKSQRAHDIEHLMRYSELDAIEIEIHQTNVTSVSTTNPVQYSTKYRRNNGRDTLNKSD